MVLFIYGFAIIYTVILAMAFFLELFNANEGTPFVQWVFRATDRMMQPFRGILPAVEGESGSLPRSGAALRDVHVLVARARDACLGRLDRPEDRGCEVSGASGYGACADNPTRWSRGQRTQVLPADRRAPGRAGYITNEWRRKLRRPASPSAFPFATWTPPGPGTNACSAKWPTSSPTRGSSSSRSIPVHGCSSTSAIEPCSGSSVKDVEAARDRLVTMLMKSIRPIERVEGVIAFVEFSDPDGNHLSLYQVLE